MPGTPELVAKVEVKVVVEVEVMVEGVIEMIRMPTMLVEVMGEVVEVKERVTILTQVCGTHSPPNKEKPLLMQEMAGTQEGHPITPRVMTKKQKSKKKNNPNLRKRRRQPA